MALKRAAEHDRLTGLFNRASFDRRLAAAMRRADNEPVIVALLDLDGFKDVNDTLGHLVGDRVLVALAAHLHQRIGKGVLLARWGGDEFALLFPPAMTMADVTVFLESLIGELSDVVSLGSSALTIGATCGVACMAQVGHRRGNHAPRRSRALSRQGAGARQRGVLGPPDRGRGQCERQRAIARLRAALHEGRALAVYQPIVEAWHRPDRFVRGAVAAERRGWRADYRQRNFLRPCSIQNYRAGCRG